MTNIILRGYADLEGETLGVFLAGLDCGDFPVIGSRITIPLDGTIAGGLLTTRYLDQVSALGRDWGMNTVILDGGLWNVPCVVGYRYVSRGQILRPVSGEDTGAAKGPGFGKFRSIHQYAVQLVATRGLRVGTNFNRLKTTTLASARGVAYTPTELFTGIITEPLEDESGYDGMICWEVRGPFSAMITAIGGFIETVDR